MQGVLTMPSAMLRASYTISSPTLKRFNAVVPQGERSHIVERFMQLALAEKEAELEKIADQYMADPAFATCRADEVLWDVTVNDGLEDA
jgi:hypothetical protein